MTEEASRPDTMVVFMVVVGGRGDDRALGSEVDVARDERMITCGESDLSAGRELAIENEGIPRLQPTPGISKATVTTTSLFSSTRTKNAEARQWRAAVLKK
jgi:copper oxidase (laccase) domain-containing protein